MNAKPLPTGAIVAIVCVVAALAATMYFIFKGGNATADNKNSASGSPADSSAGTANSTKKPPKKSVTPPLSKYAAIAGLGLDDLRNADKMTANGCHSTLLLGISDTHSGKEVAWLQRYLNLAKGNKLVVDGSFGKKTEAACFAAFGKKSISLMDLLYETASGTTGNTQPPLASGTYAVTYTP